MIRPSFTNIQTLLMVARLGTFTATAKALNTTQSSISARIRELERSLGFDLFVRQGRKLQLTLAARQLIVRIEPLVEALEGAILEVEREDPSGTLRIGLVETSLPLFGSLISELHCRLPLLQFAVNVDLSANLVSELQAGRLDLAIVAMPIDGMEFRSFSLGKSAFSWVCATSLRTRMDGLVRTATELFREELLWIAPKPSNFYQSAVDELLAFDADLGHLCTIGQNMLSMAFSGAGIVLLPDVMSSGGVKDCRLSRICSSQSVKSSELFLVVPESQRQKAVLAVERQVIELATLQSG